MDPPGFLFSKYSCMDHCWNFAKTSPDSAKKWQNDRVLQKSLPKVKWFWQKISKKGYLLFAELIENLARQKRLIILCRPKV